MFTLKQAVELYDMLQDKIKECDEKIEEFLLKLADKADASEFVSSNRTRRKNQPYFDLGKQLYRVTGVDLTAIDGIDSLTAQTIISECGFDLRKFPTEKHFASWLALCPENRITGGKVKKRRSRKSENRAATALRLAAQSLHHSDSAMGAFYRRIKAKVGAPKATTATARKLACLVYRMLRFGMAYVDQGQKRYEELYRQQQTRILQHRAALLGYALVNIQTGVVS